MQWQTSLLGFFISFSFSSHKTLDIPALNLPLLLSPDQRYFSL